MYVIGFRNGWICLNPERRPAKDLELRDGLVDQFIRSAYNQF